MTIETGVVARINVSEHPGNDGRIVDVVGRLNERYWLVWDGAPFNGYVAGTSEDIPIDDREYVTKPLLAIEAWKLQRVY